MDDRSIYVRFDFDAGFAADRTYQPLATDDRVVPITASVWLLDEDEEPSGEPISKTEMRLILFDAANVSEICDAEELESLWRALFCRSARIPTGIKQPYNLKSNDVLLIDELGDASLLPNILTRFRQVCGFRGAVLYEGDEPPTDCEMLEPGLYILA